MKSRSLKSFLVVVSLLTACGSIRAEAELLSYGEFDGSTAGYLGCVQGRYQDSMFLCFVVYRIANGNVHASVQGRLPAEPPLYVSKTYREDVEFSGSALAVVDKGRNPPWLIFEGTFPRTGYVRLIVFSSIFGSQTAWRLRCSPSFVVSGSSVGIDTRDEGSIDGVEVIEANRGDCNAYFTGPASGRWMLTGLTDERNFEHLPSSSTDWEE